MSENGLYGLLLAGAIFVLGISLVAIDAANRADDRAAIAECVELYLPRDICEFLATAKW